MKMLLINRPVILGIALLASLAVACSTNATQSPTAIPTSVAEPTATAKVANPSPTPSQGDSPTSTPAPYDSGAMMFRILSRISPFGPGGNAVEEARRLAALDEIRQQDDTSQVPVLIESLRFLPNDRDRENVAELLRDFTGQQLSGDEWFEWTQWYGRNSVEFQPPENYLEWKIAILSQISPRFGDFLRPAAEFTAVDTTEIQWGGVLPDGIPDLQNPPHITPDEADYLSFHERVFGISINGEHRAYPLRITNPHEMVNDTLGGEPFALSW